MKDNPVEEGYIFWAIYYEATFFCYKVLMAARVKTPNL